MSFKICSCPSDKPASQAEGAECAQGAQGKGRPTGPQGRQERPEPASRLPKLTKVFEGVLKPTSPVLRTASQCLYVSMKSVSVSSGSSVSLCVISHQSHLDNGWY